MRADKKQKMLYKIVYFDEESITDFMQIVADGKLEKTTELLEEAKKSGDTATEGRVGIGIGGVLKTLIGFEASVAGKGSLETSFSTGNMVKSIVTNTILTDFINFISGQEKIEEKSINVIRKFEGYSITVSKDSMSYMVLLSPYLSMLKSGTSIKADDFDIAVDKMDNTLKNAKGYYEFIGSKNGEKFIFRFNINSFKNNYKPSDLLKMDISIYAIKVGRSTIRKLNIDYEFEIESPAISKDNPEWEKNVLIEETKNSEEDEDNDLDVYDVLLAGIEV